MQNVLGIAVNTIPECALLTRNRVLNGSLECTVNIEYILYRQQLTKFKIYIVK